MYVIVRETPRVRTQIKRERYSGRLQTLQSNEIMKTQSSILDLKRDSSRFELNASNNTNAYLGNPTPIQMTKIHYNLQ